MSLDFGEITRRHARHREIRRLKQQNLPCKKQRMLIVFSQYMEDTKKMYARFYRAWTNGDSSMNALVEISDVALAAKGYTNLPDAVRTQLTSRYNALDIYNGETFYAFGSDQRRGRAVSAALKQVDPAVLTDINTRLKEVARMVSGVSGTKLPSVTDGVIARTITKFRGGAQKVIAAFKVEVAAAYDSMLPISNHLRADEQQLLTFNRNLSDAYQEKLAEFHQDSIDIIVLDLRIQEATDRLVAISNDNANIDNSQEVGQLTEVIQQLERTRAEIVNFRMATVGTMAEYRGLRTQCFDLARKIRVGIDRGIPLWNDKMLAAATRAALNHATDGITTFAAATNTMMVEQAKLAQSSAKAIQQAIEAPLIEAKTVKEVNTAILGIIDDITSTIADGRINRRVEQQEIAEEEKRLVQGLMKGAYELISDAGSATTNFVTFSASGTPVVR